MRDVAILGAGELGGNLAHLLARREVASLIRLIDPGPMAAPGTSHVPPSRVAEGKALDIRQAAAIEGFATPVEGSSDLTLAVGAAVLVLADTATGEWGDDDGLALLRQVRQGGSDALIVCAGASHRLLIERAVRELHIPPHRILGTAPEALASAMRALVALEVDGSPRDVALTVLGIPPGHIVVGWEGASIGGAAAVRVLDEPARRRLSGKAAHLWPPGPHALATVAYTAIGASLEHAERVMSCFVGPDDSFGMRTRTAALPVRLASEGLRIQSLEALSHRERTDVDSALLL
jgi:malate dehydrogenase